MAAATAARAAAMLIEHERWLFRQLAISPVAIARTALRVELLEQSAQFLRGYAAQIDVGQLGIKRLRRLRRHGIPARRSIPAPGN